MCIKNKIKYKWVSPRENEVVEKFVAKRLCETEIKKIFVYFEARLSIVKIKIVTIEYSPSQNKTKIMQGTAKAMDAKNTFL